MSCPAAGCRCRSSCPTGRRRDVPRRCDRDGNRRRATRAARRRASASAKRWTVSVPGRTVSWSFSVTTHRVALDRGLERLRLVEVEHDARAVARLDHVQAAQRRFVHRALGRAQVVGRVEEVERDARRARDGEASPADSRAAPSSWKRTTTRPELARETRHVLEAVGCLRIRRAGQHKSEESDQCGRPTSSPRARSG